MADGIDALFQGEVQDTPIVLGKGTDAEVDSGQIDAFVRAQGSAHQDPTMNLLTLNRFHFELDEAVVEENRVPRINRVGEPRKAHCGVVSIADDVLGLESEHLPALQIYRLLSQTAHAYLGTR